MFPKNMDFEFYLDSIKFVVIMFIAATIGMIYCAYLYIIREVRIVRSKYVVISVKLHSCPRKNDGFEWKRQFFLKTMFYFSDLFLYHFSIHKNFICLKKNIYIFNIDAI